MRRPQKKFHISVGNESACCCLSASRHYVFEKHPDALNCTFLLQCTIKSKFAQTKLKSGIIKSMRLNRIQVCVCNIWQKIFQNTRETKITQRYKKTKNQNCHAWFLPQLPAMLCLHHQNYPAFQFWLHTMICRKWY